MDTREQPLGGVEDLVDAEGGGTLAVLARAEINQQIATAKAYPRSVTAFQREAQQLATLNEEMARSCVYALPRGGKTIEGPSARFAEIVAYSFRNMRFGARPVLEEQEYITSQGVAYDLERNNGTTIEVRRRITGSNGQRFNADMIGVTANACNSIALRNAVLKIIPKALWNPIYQQARHVIIGDFETFNNRLAKMFEEFQRYGATKEMICLKLEKKGVADIKIDDMVVLAGMLTALQEGDSSPEQMFATAPLGSSQAVRQPAERKDDAQLSADEQAKVEARKKELAAQAEVAAQAKHDAAEKDKPAPARRKRADDKTGQGELPGAGKPPETAPGQPTGGESSSDKPQNGGATANMLKQIELRIESYGVDKNKLLGNFGITQLSELKAADVNKVLEWIEQNGTE